MKIKRSLISLILSFILILTAIIPLTKVYGANGSTKLHIIKVRVKDSTKFNEAEHDGSKLTDLKNLFGDSVETIAGVDFTLFKVDDQTKFDAMLKAPQSYDTVEKVKKDLPSAETKTVTTDKTGDAVIESLADGNWWGVESRQPVGFTEAKAVPFGMTLPAFKDNKRLDEMYIYPKNTVEDPFDPTIPNNPTLKKTVIDDKTMVGNFDTSEEQKWVVTAKVPKKATSLKKLDFRENLDTRLDFKDGSVTVKVGETNLSENTDYTLTKPNATSRLLEVKFNQTGISKLTDETKNIVIEYKTSINKDKVILGAPIYNGIQVVFGNTPEGDRYSEIPPTDPSNPDNQTNKPHGPKPFPTPTPDGKNPPEPVKPSEKPGVPPVNPPKEGESPYVITGGKVFVKQDQTNHDTKLGDAEFNVVKVENTKIYVLTGTQGNGEWKEVTDATTTDNNTELSEKITKAKESLSPLALKSDSTGNFEVKGLKFGDYKLVEIKAPKGYGLPTNLVDFTIDANSYYKDFTNLSANAVATADRQVINNQKFIIPQTGGIGTGIIIGAGIILIILAFILYKRKNKDI